MKVLLDLIPIIAFFVGYITYDVYIATFAAIVATLVAVAMQWMLFKKIQKIQWATLVLIVTFGSATLWFKDPKFIIIKPTVLYWLFACALAASALFWKKIFIQTMLSDHIDAPPRLWCISNWAWVVVFLTLGILNLWFGLSWSEKAWVLFKTFGATSLVLLATFVQIYYLSPYIKNPD